MAEGAKGLTVQRSTESLRRILDQRHAEIGGNGARAGDIRGIAVEMRHDDRLGASRAGGGERREIGAERRRIDVVESDPDTGRSRRSHEVHASIRGKGDRRLRPNR